MKLNDDWWAGVFVIVLMAGITISVGIRQDASPVVIVVAAGVVSAVGWLGVWISNRAMDWWDRDK